jgi:hypothetical protein
MSKHLLILVTLALVISSCGSPTGSKSEKAEAEDVIINIQNENANTFFESLKQFCGKSYAGKEVFVKQGRESWANLDLTMHVTKCQIDTILIPFHVGANKSRTWMLINEEGKLRFRHDHRHEDGTPEDLTLYGGYATDSGTALHQEFPADDYTIGVHPRSTGAIWVLQLSADLSTFSYQLHHNGELLFEAEFNLTKEI